MSSIVRSHRPPPLDRQVPPSAQSGLPGAWLSTWSLSEMTPVNTEFCEDVRDDLALRKTMTSDSSEGTISLGSGAAETGYRSSRVSIVHSDGESTCSADYYSMGSDVDMDDTITPDIRPTNETQEVSLIGLKAVDVSDTSSVLSPPELEESSPALSGSGSFEARSFSTHRTTPEEYASSEGEGSRSKSALASQLKSFGTPIPGSPTALSRPARVTRVFLRPPSQIDLASPRTSVVSTSTSHTDYSGNISSSASAAYGDDESDHRSEISKDGENDDDFEFQLGHDDIGHSRVGTPSHVAVSVPPGQSHSLRKPSLGHAVTATPAPRRMDSELDFRSLGQPDGSDPWTLGLDPTLGSITELDSTTAASSRSSTLSFPVTADSDGHHSVFDEEREHIQPPLMGSQSQTSLEDSPVAASHADEDETVQVRRTLNYPSTLILEARPSTSSVARPPSTVVQKKSVAQKTKKIYQKVKRFFSPKPTRPISSKGITNNPYQPTNNVDFPAIPDSPATTDEIPPTAAAPHQWTVYRRTLFSRSRKVSTTHSLAQSFTPGDFTTQPRYFPRSASVVPDERYTYEYHARPKTLEEIKKDTKRGRRISLPVGLFSGPPSPRLTPSVNGSAIGVGRSNLGALPSISSSLHVPQQRWPQHPPAFASRSSSRME
ncbi:hypothetical protein CPB83DRAFT_848125 [Crepidotus variabilis]|uniref:Uncharacterized protein n=1 Tax=Crepidotus variabilis TaxID=179855 RepID=A0A9P6EN92_9AGAR|nr:hypothetical protein CPB83DRAFT_848125 [Crepidotus variabilis]